MKYTITVVSENKPGVLYRIADLFLRRKINIESLAVSETKEQEISRFIIVVERDPETIQKLVKQIHRIIEVTDVYEKAGVPQET
jgi:acetolactate synthase-1/3 small subunit